MSPDSRNDAHPDPPGMRVVRVWTLEPLRHAGDLQQLEPLLSAAERRRRDALATADLSARFTLRRALLRRTLGALLARPPEALAFEAGRCGKPRLAGADRGRLAFSVTHGASHSLLAVASSGVELGIDLTATDALSGADAATVLAHSERATLAGLPTSRRERAAASLWAQKEAVLKAFGCGLELDPRQLELEAHPERPPALRRLAGADDPLASLWTRGDRGDDPPPTRLELRRLAPAAPGVAALALLGFGATGGEALRMVAANGSERGRRAPGLIR